MKRAVQIVANTAVARVDNTADKIRHQNFQRIGRRRHVGKFIKKTRFNKVIFVATPCFFAVAVVFIKINLMLVAPLLQSLIGPVLNPLKKAIACLIRANKLSRAEALRRRVFRMAAGIAVKLCPIRQKIRPCAVSV